MTDAQHDPVAGDAREALCRALVPAFREAGSLLWVGGFIIGSDRVEARSPFRFGSDSTVGVATVAQIAGELSGGTAQLLEAANMYSAGALLRQFVEVEYLAWAFAEDEAEAAAWLRATKGDRLRMWQPRHLRDRSKGRFRAADYGRHCEVGGHPTPEARLLLPHHSDQLSAAWWWLEMAIHGLSTWEYLLEGAGHAGYREQMTCVADRHHVTELADSWRELDDLAFIARQSIDDRNTSGSRISVS